MNNRQKLTDKIREWYNWLTTHVPSSIRKGVSNAFDTMRKKVVKLYNSSKEEEDQWYDAKENFSDEEEKWYDVNPEKKLTPVLTKHGIKKKVRKYVINPKGAYDPVHFLSITKDEVAALINSETEPRNVSMSLKLSVPVWVVPMRKCYAEWLYYYLKKQAETRRFERRPFVKS